MSDVSQILLVNSSVDKDNSVNFTSSDKANISQVSLVSSSDDEDNFLVDSSDDKDNFSPRMISVEFQWFILLMMKILSLYQPSAKLLPKWERFPV